MALRLARRGSKYRNLPTVVDGIRFASKREAARYCELKLEEREAQIEKLTVHPRYTLMVNRKMVCVYVADFEYFHQGRLTVEDVKGVRTAVYRLKKRLMQVLHGIDVKEV